MYFAHLCQQLLCSFLHDLVNLDPWWVSIVALFNGMGTLCCIRYSLHLKTGPKKSFLVLYEEWELFIVHERLQEIMEMVNWSSISCSKHFFIRNGEKGKLSHWPMDQFSGNKPWPNKSINIIGCQKKLICSYHYKHLIIGMSNQARWKIFLNIEPMSLHFYWWQ